MSRKVEDMISLALELDYLDSVRDLLALPSGFFIETVNGYSKISGGHSFSVSGESVDISNLPIEYTLNEKDFDRVKLIANGLGCGVNNIGNLNYRTTEKNNLIYEIRTPTGKDISNILSVASGISVKPSPVYSNRLK